MKNDQLSVDSKNQCELKVDVLYKSKGSESDNSPLELSACHTLLSVQRKYIILL